MYAPVILPVVLTGFDPSAAKLATTLALPYVAGNPVSCEPLPKTYAPVTLPAVLTGFEPNAATLATTLALP